MIRDKKWAILIVVIVVVAVFIITNKKEAPLPGYDTSNDVFETTQETEKQIDSFLYTDEATGLSLSIPEGWQYVLKSGYASFVHSPSATSVQIQVMDYDPTINTVNQDSLSAEIMSAGGELIEFSWLDNSTYLDKYILVNNDKYVDYLEYTTFDKDYIVRVVYTVFDEYYNLLRDELDYSLSSISWIKPNPIPDTIYMYYNDFGHYEFGCPNGWQENFSDNVYYASDPNSGSSYTMIVQETNSDYTDVTQINYVEYVSNGRNNYSLGSYYADNTTISASGTYYSNGIRMMIRQQMVSVNGYEYILTEECPTDTYDLVANTFDNLIDAFRIW